METDSQSICQENKDVASDTAADEEAEVGVSHLPPVLHILDLPDSVIFQILVYLPFSSIGATAQVCSRFSRISSDELLWRHVFLQHYKLAANSVMPAKAKSWRQEFKRLYYHTPAVLSEERKEHKDEVLHVSFSHDGTMFATCSKDGFFKVWECTHPVRLLFKMDMKSTFSWKFTQFSQFNETDTCLLVSGVYFGRLSTSGEIAVFNLQDDFRMQCRVTNKPYDVFGAWYDNDHLLSGTLYWTGDFNSVSAVWLSKASQEVESEVESVSMVLYRFENVNSSSIRLLHVAEPHLPRTPETADFDMELDVTHASLSFAQAENEIFPNARYYEHRTELTAIEKHDLAFADLSCTKIVDSCTSLLSSPTLPSAAECVFGNTSSVNHHSVPISASSTDIPSAWSRNATENYAKSSSQEFESVNHSCDSLLSPSTSQCPSFDKVSKRTGFCQQTATTDKKCSMGNLRSCGVSTDSDIDFMPEHLMEIIMDDGSVRDDLPPCIIRAMPSISSAAFDASAVGSSADVQKDAGGTSSECFRHSLHIPLPGESIYQGTDFEEDLDNKNEDSGVASALEDTLGAKDAFRQFGDVSPPNVPSLFDNNNLVMLIPGASHVYGSRHSDDANSNNSASCFRSSISLEPSSTFERGTSSMDALLKEPGQNHKSSIATQTEVAGSRASSFHSLSHISQSSSLSRDLRLNPPREKLLIYTWGSETYIPHKVGIKRMKWTDFTKGEVTARRSSMLLPDVMENLHNMAGNRRDKPDVTIEMHGHIVGLSLSPDHKYLYVNCRPWPKNYIISDPQESPPLAQEVEISTIDLTTFNFVGPVLRSHKAYTHSDECFFLNLDVSDDYVASGAEDRQGYLWDRHYGIPLYRFPHRNVVNCVAVNPQDSEILVTVSDDYTFKVWMSRCRAAELTGSKEAETGTSV
ncbi:unnamed protein product [Candidula unifasciata]|uniref:F-box domain-containing protein n=1 Tax=Candidula unifasciata TaxID=100452 RepID=A0A8S3ZLQ1_9EUPU|nr:unnamed protein product [Candidula unifasciata]